jgi:hypothetical protein
MNTIVGVPKTINRVCSVGIDSPQDYHPTLLFLSRSHAALESQALVYDRPRLAMLMEDSASPQSAR